MQLLKRIELYQAVRNVYPIPSLSEVCPVQVQMSISMLDDPNRDGGMEMDEDEGEAFDGPSPSCDQPEDQLEEFLDCWCGHSISMDASEANMDVTPKRLLDSSWSSTENCWVDPWIKLIRAHACGKPEKHK